MRRVIPPHIHAGEVEINTEQVFMPTKREDHRKIYIDAVVSQMIIQFGAAEFTTLEKEDEST